MRKAEAHEINSQGLVHRVLADDAFQRLEQYRGLAIGDASVALRIAKLPGIPCHGVEVAARKISKILL